MLSSGAAMFAVPLTTATQWPNSLRHCLFYALVRHVPALPTHSMRLGRCGTVCWRSQGCHGPSECAQGRLFDPESAEKWRGAVPLRALLQREDTPLRNPHCFSSQCSRKSGHFVRELLLSVHGLSRPFPHLVRGSNEVGGA